MAAENKNTEPAIDDTSVTEILADIYPPEEDDRIEEPQETGFVPKPAVTQDQLTQFEKQQPYRERVLDSASDKISGVSEKVYGAPGENFARIAQLWSVLFGRPVTVLEVALALDLVKTSRLIQSPTHLDSWVDKVGYSALGGELAEAGN